MFDKPTFSIFSVSMLRVFGYNKYKFYCRTKKLEIL